MRETTGDRWFPLTERKYCGNISMSWRHYYLSRFTWAALCFGDGGKWDGLVTSRYILLSNNYLRGTMREIFHTVTWYFFIIFCVVWLNNPFLRFTYAFFICKIWWHLSVKGQSACLYLIHPRHLENAGHFIYPGTMSAMASQITGVSIVYVTVCSNADQRNHKAPRHCPLWGKFTGHQSIPRTKGQ